LQNNIMLRASPRFEKGPPRPYFEARGCEPLGRIGMDRGRHLRKKHRSVKRFFPVM